MASSQEPQPFRWRLTDLDDRSFEIRGRTLFLIVVLFSVMLLLTLLFLYARWVCRYHHPSSHAPHAPPPPATRSAGLDPLTIRSLPMILFRSLEAPKSGDLEEQQEQDVECCICLGVFEDGDKVKVLPLCKHCFHAECVDKWLCSHSSCPLCRASLRDESQVDSEIPQIVVVQWMNCTWTQPMSKI